jgi:hypothetical protein
MATGVNPVLCPLHRIWNGRVFELRHREAERLNLPDFALPFGLALNDFTKQPTICAARPLRSGISRDS